MTRPELSTDQLAAEWRAVTMKVQIIQNQERRGSLRTVDRNMSRYEEEMSGLTHAFDYVRGLSSNLVVDVGAGMTVGIDSISKSWMGRDLSCLATGLYCYPQVENYLGFERFRATSVEVMNGFDDNSVSFVLGHFSIGYSASPFLAIKRLDEILVPGGIIKTTFRLPGESTNLLGYYDRFADMLEAFGYEWDYLENDHALVVLAMKQGNMGGTTATGLLRADEESYRRRAPVNMYEKSPFTSLSL